MNTKFVRVLEVGAHYIGVDIGIYIMCVYTANISQMHTSDTPCRKKGRRRQNGKINRNYNVLFNCNGKPTWLMKHLYHNVIKSKLVFFSCLF